MRWWKKKEQPQPGMTNVTGLEPYRVTTGTMASDSSHGMNGVFSVPVAKNLIAQCVVSDGSGMPDLVPWEHVSVTMFYKSSNARKKIKNRMPTWEEMQHIKNLFWQPDAVVMQLHVASADHINTHPNVLHLWRPLHAVIPTPPHEAV